MMVRLLAFLAAALPALAQEPPAYVDDRSDPASLMRSYYNAVNRQEYARAWSYFAQPPADYAAFAAGYAETAQVELALGTPVSEGAAGSVYTALPMAIRATDSTGSVRVFAGCATLRQVQGAVQDPPFRPIQIEAAHLAPTEAAFENAVPESCPE
jgi:hypothetical protein